MTQADLVQLKDALRMVKEMGIIGADESIAIHSAWPEQAEAMRETFGERIRLLNKDVWNIKNGKTKEIFGLLVFCNVFMYINTPEVAFKNVLGSCRYLLIQDIIKRDRGPKIFGSDGDCMRYTYGGIKSNYAKAFDIGNVGNVIRFVPYIDDKRWVHFIALITHETNFKELLK